MGSDKNQLPAFFEDDSFDPVKTATGVAREPFVHRISNSHGRQPRPAMAAASQQAGKKKAGFYLSVSLLERFTRKFHELKLAGVQIENKSALLEAALSLALDDMDQGEASTILKRLITNKD